MDNCYNPHIPHHVHYEHYYDECAHPYGHHHHHHCATPEYPHYGFQEHSTLNGAQADWLEHSPHSGAYIRNKPNFVLSINNVRPDMRGHITLTAKDLGIGSIPLPNIFKAVDNVFDIDREASDD